MLLLRLPLILCFILAQVVLVVDGYPRLNCVGATYSGALANCPDNGGQMVSSGGNVTVRVLYATNMPNQDSTGPSAGVSDPYVLFRVGNVVARTKTRRNTLNPAWNEDVSLGFLTSATQISVEIWDQDSGLEFSDDLLVTGKFRVPFCSMFYTYANTTSVDCGEPFNCYAEDSLWENPSRQQCTYSAVLNFDSRFTCSSSLGVCLFYEVYVVPFQMKVEKVNTASNLVTPRVTVLANPVSGKSFTSTYGFPYIGVTSTSVDPTTTSSVLRGGLMFRTSRSDKSYGAANSVKFYFSINFPATVHVCRLQADNAKGVPSWLLSGFSSLYLLARQVVFSSSGSRFQCYVQEVAGTRKNRWDGLISGMNEIRANTVSGRDSNSLSDQLFYSENSIVVVTPRTISTFSDVLRIVYDAGMFLDFLGSYGLITLWFIYLVLRFLDKIDYRADRLSAYLLTRVLTGDGRNLLASLFLPSSKSSQELLQEANGEFRSTLFHARNAMVFLLSLPLWLLLTWGLSVASKVRPRIFGLFLAFVGIAACTGYYTIRLWARSHWRLSSLAVSSALFTLFAHTLFLLTALWADPAVLQLDQAINITCLSLIFATLNAFPNLYLIFQHDRVQQIYLALIVQRIEQAAQQQQQSSPTNKGYSRPGTTSGGGANGYVENVELQGGDALHLPLHVQVNKTLHHFLKEGYALNPRLPVFAYSTALSEIPESYASLSAQIRRKQLSEDESVADEESFSSNFDQDDNGEKRGSSSGEDKRELSELKDYRDELLKGERKVYFVSICILFVYLMIAIAVTEHASLAFLHICALLCLDSILLCMSKGDRVWSPGFKVSLMVFGRLFICGSIPRLWILSYSATYLLFAYALSYEVLNEVLPILSERSAGQIVFGGSLYLKISEMLKTEDVAGNPLWCLIYLTVCFSSLLVLSIYTSDPSDSVLAADDISVLGQRQIPVAAFGLAALLLVAVFSFVTATYRAWSLATYDLLRGWAKKVYFLHPKVTLPVVLLGVSEMAILLTGLCLYSVTESTAVLVFAIFLPLILGCLGNAARIWVKQDFSLVVWPRKPKPSPLSSDYDPSNNNNNNGEGTMVTAGNNSNNPAGINGRGFSRGRGQGGEDDLDVAFSMLDSMFNSNNGATTNNNNMALTLSDVHFDGQGYDTMDGNDYHQSDALRPSSSTGEVGGLEDTAERQRKIERTLKGFALPSLSNISSSANNNNNTGEGGIKMPPLPLKSVLRRKRQNLGIKTLAPGSGLVSDLRQRDVPESNNNNNTVTSVGTSMKGKGNNNNNPFGRSNNNNNNNSNSNNNNAPAINSKDVFGGRPNSSSIVQIEDPWAEFEEDEELLAEQRALELKKKRAKKGVTQKEEISAMRRMILSVQQNKTMQKVFRVGRDVFKGVTRKIRVHPSSQYRPSYDNNNNNDGEDGEDNNDNNNHEGDDDSDSESETDEAGQAEREKHETAEERETRLVQKVYRKKQRAAVKKLESGGVLDESEIALVPFWSAAFAGLLNDEEYGYLASFFGGLLFIFFFGLTLSLTVEPPYLGTIVWVVLCELLGVSIPLIKYYYTYTFEADMKRLLTVSGFLHFLFCLVFFSTELHASIQIVGSLWLWDFFIYTPLFVYVAYLVVGWVDNRFTTFLDERALLLLARAKATESCPVTTAEIWVYVKSFPAVMVYLAILNWQFYVFINYTFGTVVTLILLLSGFGYYYLSDWATNDYFLSPELAQLGSYLLVFVSFISFCVALFREDISPTFAWSVFCLTQVFRQLLNLLYRYLIWSPDTKVYFSPSLLPVYSVNNSTVATTNNNNTNNSNNNNNGTMAYGTNNNNNNASAVSPFNTNNNNNYGGYDDGNNSNNTVGETPRTSASSDNNNTRDVRDESDTIRAVFSLLVWLLLWGDLLCVFFSPLSIGVAVSSFILLLAVSLFALAVSFVPRQLAKVQSLLRPSHLQQARDEALRRFHDRKLPLSLEMRDYDPNTFTLSEDKGNGNNNNKGTKKGPAGINSKTLAGKSTKEGGGAEDEEDPEEVRLREETERLKQEEEMKKSLLERLKSRTSLENALSLLQELRSLKYVSIDLEVERELQRAQLQLQNEEDEFELPWYRRLLQSLKDYSRQVYELMPVNKGNETRFSERGVLYKKHQQHPFTWHDAFLECYFQGRGPYGWLGLEGLWYRWGLKMKYVPGRDDYLYRDDDEDSDEERGRDEDVEQGQGPQGQGEGGGGENETAAVAKKKDKKRKKKPKSGSSDSSFSVSQCLSQWLYPSWTETYTSAGVDSRLVPVSDLVDYSGVYRRVLLLDQALDHCFEEEHRCAAHFLLLSLLSAEALQQRERWLFQRFIRENRVRLASNGIAPPRDIFHSLSYSGVSLSLTANWLLTLSPEERQRFITLQETFRQEQSDRDHLVDDHDTQFQLTQYKVQQLWAQRDADIAHTVSLALFALKQKKIQQFLETLEGPEKQKFLLRQDLWVSDPNCFVDSRDMELYERFRSACLVPESEALTQLTQDDLTEIENAQKDIRLGEYGRTYQYVDSTFLPSDTALGDCPGRASVWGWRCAPGLTPDVGLFDGGTNVEDLAAGVFGSEWLLTALGMILGTSQPGQKTLSSSSISSKSLSGLINDQIRSLFIAHRGSAASGLDDSALSLNTEVGVYCLRLARHGQWTPVIVDDLFPVRQKEDWLNENRGFACAHVVEGRALYVSLIEKAFAKYLGSYAALMSGSVPLALSTLTGCEAEAISLSPYRRSLTKLTLWENLVEFRRNGYLLGVQSDTADLMDAEVVEQGIVPDASYVIIDVVQVDSFRLIKLRTPPGVSHSSGGVHNSVWTGDWSAQSPLWTSRLKYKAGYSLLEQRNPNVFYVSLDDFLEMFSHVYLCRYYDSRRWRKTIHPGLWKRADESSVEQMDLMHQLLLTEGEAPQVSLEDLELQNRRRLKARTDSAGGLPSRHNPGVILENNPHYTLRLFRPTDLRITVTQYQPRDVRGTLQPKPFSIIVVKNSHSSVPSRLKSLKKEDVLYSTGEPKAEKQLHLYINRLDPGLYIVLVGAYVAGMEGHFVFEVLSNYRCDSNALWPPQWMLKDEVLPGEFTDANAAADAAGDKRAQMVAQARRRFLQGGDTAKAGVASFGKRLRGTLKTLFGQGHEEVEEDDDSATKGKDDMSFGV